MKKNLNRWKDGEKEDKYGLLMKNDVSFVVATCECSNDGMICTRESSDGVQI